MSCARAQKDEELYFSSKSTVLRVFGLFRWGILFWVSSVGFRWLCLVVFWNRSAEGKSIYRLKMKLLHRWRHYWQVEMWWKDKGKFRPFLLGETGGGGSRQIRCFVGRWFSGIMMLVLLLGAWEWDVPNGGVAKGVALIPIDHNRDDTSSRCSAELNGHNKKKLCILRNRSTEKHETIKTLWFDYYSCLKLPPGDRIMTKLIQIYFESCCKRTETNLIPHGAGSCSFL